MTFHKDYGTEGPLGIPMTDRQAFALEELLKTLPEELRTVRKAVTEKAPTELMEGERSDVSWISEQSVDRDKEVVLAKGMDDSHFRLNPIVTLNHYYNSPPVGKSVWRKKAKDGTLVGVKAKTHYPPRPTDWPEAQPWGPDVAFGLVKSDMLRGKSIGFIPKAVHIPTDQEKEKHKDWADVRLIIDEWLLLEYACCFLPAQQNAVVEEVSKGLALPESFKEILTDLFGLDTFTKPTPPPEPKELPPIPFTNIDVIRRHLERELAKVNPLANAEKLIQERLDLMRGRV